MCNIYICKYIHIHIYIYVCTYLCIYIVPPVPGPVLEAVRHCVQSRQRREGEDDEASWPRSSRVLGSGGESSCGSCFENRAKSGAELILIVLVWQCNSYCGPCFMSCAGRRALMDFPLMQLCARTVPRHQWHIGALL